MEKKDGEPEKNNENVESAIKESNDIEPIETIQSSFKGNPNFEKRKNYYQKPYHNTNHYHTSYSNFPNQNTMSKNRTSSVKYSGSRYNNPNYGKNINNEPKNKNYNHKKKRIQDINYNEYSNSNKSDSNKLNFVNKYKEAEDLNYYDTEFSKIGNLNFLKQSWKQKYPHEDENEFKNLNLNMLNPSNFMNFNQFLNFNQFAQNNSNVPMKYNANNFGGNKSLTNLPNIPNNVSSPNKASKANTKIMNSMMNFPMNLNNNNINNLINMNNPKINGINSMLIFQNYLNNNLNNNIRIQQQQNNLNKPAGQSNETSNNKSPQKINKMNNLNNKNQIYVNQTNNNNLSNQAINSFNALIQFYYKTLQCQSIVLTKMSQLFSQVNNAMVHTDIQNTINQLKLMLSNEMSQISSILPQNPLNQNNSNSQTNNSVNNTNINTNNFNNNDNKDNKDNIENKENKDNNEIIEKENNSKYIQNILSTWPEQKFIKPYSPLLKLDKNHIKPSNLYNSNNATLNINTYTNNLSPNYLINLDHEYNKQNEIKYDEEKIEEYLKEGKCLQGIIRMNKSKNLSHGYITVEGINNDILVRGKNLDQSLHLDEVIVELLDYSQWKSLANKKTKKISHVNEEGLINNVIFTDENKNQKMKSLDEENNLKSKEEKLKYINNKLFDLRPEGRIVKIIKSPNREKEQICSIQIEKNKINAIPIDENIPTITINIRNISKKLIQNNEVINKSNYNVNDFEKDYANYKKKYFSVKIYSVGVNNKGPSPFGYIVNEIGESGNIDVESEVLLKRFNAFYNEGFSDDIMKEVNKKLEEIKITDEYIKNTKRKDFRNELVFTIDPYTSKDLDDAIHVKVIDEKTKLLEIGVHIADPTAYVEKDSLLDKEALFRGTTLYLVQKNISMLPRILSESVCSIMPKKDTLAISSIFRIYLDGSLEEKFEPYFCLSVVNSKAKWDYDLVQKIIEKKEVNYNDLKAEDGTKPETEEIFNNLKKSVDILYQLTKSVRKARFDSGSLMIDNDDIYFDLDKNTNYPKSFHISVKNESHNLIEELMLISNLFCAKYLYKNIKKYSLVRRHPFFNDNKFIEIQRYFSLNKMNPLDFDDPTEINKSLTKIKKTNMNKYQCIQHKLKTFILRAEYVFAGKYSMEELKHSSLNYDLYTHFTSPIRRYPDIIVHRQLKEIFKFENKETPQINVEIFKDYFGQIEHINERYNNGKLISQKSKRIFQCLYLKSAPKKLYTALIMDIISKNNKKPNNANNSVNNLMNMGNNPNYLNNNNNNEEEELYLVLFVPEINLELEWRKSDNEEIVLLKYDKNKNELHIDYKIDNLGCKNLDLKPFDSLQVELLTVDSIPMDAKCKINFKSKDSLNLK